MRDSLRNEIDTFNRSEGSNIPYITRYVYVHIDVYKYIFIGIYFLIKHEEV